ncbi:MAG TPA: hypothetical protein PL063_01880 [Candidatus Cloacimonadota bacterium]|jgi:hypothetical protein|nr:hypothetical protein [Candidatus Cloacimonadales bacterium]HPY95943.1 hypothetical protein [Candidatus Cloacimonadota bacterium]HQB40403.1 hypothetical protein [Candidatus Cloacimonadota bacterium]
MIKSIGRLEYKEIKMLKERVDEIYDFIIYDGEDRAVRELNNLLNTQNYYVREIVGKHMATYDNQEKISLFVLQNFTSSKIYGVRAAGLFYYWELHKNDPNSLISLLNGFWDNTPWEVEAIILDMWERYPEQTKLQMHSWLDSENPKQRVLAMHGIENLAFTDLEYVYDTIAKHIDDDNEDVIKKISNIVFHVTKNLPENTFPHIRDWLLNAKDVRANTIKSILDKLLEFAIQNKTNEEYNVFRLLLFQVIKDWQLDDNKLLVDIAIKLQAKQKSIERNQEKEDD